MKMLTENRIGLLKNKGRRFLSLLLCFAMILGLLSTVPATAFASQTKTAEDASAADDAAASTSRSASAKFEGATTASVSEYPSVEVSNTYVLRAYTGVNSGAYVLYIGVCYRDVNNIERTEFFFPNNGAWKASITLSESIVGTNPAADKYATMNGKYASALGSNPLDKSKVGLQTETVDDYLFRPTYQVKEFLGYDIMVRELEDASINGEEQSAALKGKKALWTCQGLQLFEASSIKGYDMYGYYSKDIYLDFEGKLICELAMPDGNTVNYSAESGTDELIQVREKSAGVAYTNSTKLNMGGEAMSCSDQCLVKVDVADVSGAGIDGIVQNNATAVTSISDMKNAYEGLVVQVIYYDTHGSKHTVKVPAVLSMLCYLNKAGLGQEALFEIAQPGNSILVPLNLPGYNGEKPEIGFYFGGNNAADQCGVITAGTDNNGDNMFCMAGFQVYDHVGSIGIKNYLLVTDLGTPKWYFTASAVSGYELSGSNTKAVTLGDSSYKEYKSGAKLAPTSSTSGIYLVELTTFGVDAAGTTDDILLKFLYKTSAASTITEEFGFINVREKVEEFYGLWPTNPVDSGAYGMGASGGGVLRFFVEIENVYQFTGVQIQIANAETGLSADATDDYQMEKIVISDVQDKGARTIQFLGADPNLDDSVTTFWEIDRDYASSGVEYVNMERTTLVQPNEIKEITFGSAAEVVVSNVDIDWSKFDTEGFTYDDATQYMGYTKTRAIYTITAKVADDTASTSETGDAGSSNRFYFQLVFLNGKTSGYVLANQLIAAGKFRSSYPETFEIYMNYDYGDVSAVRVIPDDTIDEGEEFDKLHLEYIKVERQENAGINPVWQCTVSAIDDGWIGIDYQDSGAQSTASGQVARSEGDLARTYTVDSASYSVNFLMEIGTKGYNLGEGETENKGRFVGTLFADIKYKDSNGVIQTESIDVFERMAQYLNITASKSPESLKIDGKSGSMINTTYMLKEKSSNWLSFTLDDPGEGGITSVDLRGSSQEVTDWYIDRLAIYRNLSGDGELVINSEGQYIRNYTPSLLDENTDENHMYMPANEASQKLSIPIECTLDIDTELNKWRSKIGKEPASVNDTLNVYVYMEAPDEENGNVTIPDSLSDYNMYFEVEYSATDANGIVPKENLTSSVKRMNKDESNYVFYTTGINVSGITSIKQIKLESRDKDNPDYRADKNIQSRVTKVVMERVRGGVVIDTYYVYFTEGTNNTNSRVAAVIGTPTAEKKVTGEKQVVYLRLGDSTSSFTVNADNSDIAVAITYRTTNMDMVGAAETYASRYIFLSELNYNATKLNAGDVVAIPFSEQNVENIVGIRVAKVGEMSATISAASVCMYDAGGACTACLGSMVSQTLQVQPKVINVTAGDMVPITLTLTTAQTSTDANSGCNGSIKMAVNYKDAAGSVQNYEVADITKLVATGSFSAGNTATFTILVPALASLDSLDFVPYDSTGSTSNSTVTWKPAAISVQVLGKSVGTDSIAATIDRTVNKVYYEDNTYTINLRTLQLTATVQAQGGTAFNMADGSETEVTVNSGEKVVFSPKLAGSDEGISVSVSVKSSNGVESKCDKTITDNAGGYTFTALDNTSSSDQVYTITISAKENSTKKLIITVTVPGKEISLSAEAILEGGTEFVSGDTMHVGDTLIIQPVGGGSSFVANSTKGVVFEERKGSTLLDTITTTASQLTFTAEEEGTFTLYMYAVEDNTKSYSITVNVQAIESGE